MRYLNILTTVGPDHRVVTVNERLARFLWSLHLNQGSSIQAAANIQSYQTWIHNLWKQVEWSVPGLPSLIQASQSLVVWHAIIEAHTEEEPLLFGAETAQLVREAWLMLKQWKMSVAELEVYGAHPFFLNWVNAFEEKCRNLSVHDEADLLSLLLQTEDVWIRTLPKQVSFVGFDHQSPQLKYLIERCQASGIQVSWVQEDHQVAATEVYVAFNRTEEWFHACEAARIFLHEHPQASTAIVIPDLEREREAVLSVAQNVFLGSSPLNESIQTWPFTISGGQALATVPIIASALLSIRMWNLHLFAEWSTWIRSPFITGGLEEASARLRLDLMLREMVNQKISFLTLKQAIETQGSTPILQALFDRVAQFHMQRSFNMVEWRNWIYQILDTVGWPGSQKLSSDEYQAVQHFYQIIDGLVKLDGFQSAVSYPDYCSILLRATMHCSFSSESAPKARCHILGVLEAAGLYFDRIWFCGLSDTVWPREPSPNPFIPFVLARHYDLPRSSPQRELHFARHVMQSLHQACHTLVLSYPMMQRSLIQNPSPLLPFDQRPQSLPRFESRLVQQFRNRPALIEMQDDRAPVMPLDELAAVKGGANILRAVALCPFQAFARYRLNAKALQEPKGFIDILTRGLLVHEALERLWQSLKTQASLLQQTEKEIARLIAQVVSQVLNRAAQGGVMISPIWYQLEHQRLSELLTQWLKLERDRPPFSVIALEKKIFFQLEGIPMNLRIDRIDRIATGETVIVDYKTGRISVKEWFGERLLAPQLPLYALACEADGIVWAAVKNQECRWQGVGAHEGLDPCLSIDLCEDKEANDWSTQKKIWHHHIRRLAQQFIQGDARVDPYSYEKACRTCDLNTLCRIHEEL